MRRISTLTLAVALGMCASLPFVAQAESVIVLGLRSVEGDDEFAQNLSGALRHGAGQIPGWELNTREISLAQMTLAHGCDEADVACMAQIGSTLGVELIIYGTVRRTGTGNDYDYAVNLFLFDAGDGRIMQSLADTIPRAQSDIDQLRTRVRRYVNQLSGTTPVGTLRIQVNVDGAEILIDGSVVGSSEGGRYASEVLAGQHEVEIRREGHRTFRGSVTVAGDQESLLEVELLEGDEEDVVIDDGTGPVLQPSPGGPNWGAIVSFGAAAIFAGLTIGAWVALDCLGESSPADLCGPGAIQTWRAEVQSMLPPTAGEVDVCNFNAVQMHGINITPEAQSACSSRNTWTALEYVFLGATIATSALGIVFLMLGGDDDEASPVGENARLRLLPGVGPDGGNLTARLIF